MNGHRINNSHPPFPPADKLRNALFARAKSETLLPVPGTVLCPLLSFQEHASSLFQEHASSLIKPHSNVPVPPASGAGAEQSAMQEERTLFGGSVVRNIPEPSTEPDQFAPHPVKNTYVACRQGHNGHDAWMDCSADEPAKVVQEVVGVEPVVCPKKLGKDFAANTRKRRQSQIDLFAAVPAAGTSKAEAASFAAELVADLEAPYARASPSAARAVPFAPDGAAPRRRPALLRRPVERWAMLPSAPPLEPPCATVAAARALHHALRCLPCAGRLSGRKRRRCTPTRATRTRAHCGTVRPRALALCARTRLCAFSLRWRARARSTRWVGFFRRRLRRDLKRRRRSIPRPCKNQSPTCSRG